MKHAKIIGTGSYLPNNIITNVDLEKKIDTTDDWIQQRTGIVSRCIAEEADNVVTMGTKAAEQAISYAGIDKNNIDLIIVATCSACKVFPSAACLIQEQLGIANKICFDAQAACSGFIYALSIAKQYIATGEVKNALIIGSEVMSRVVDWQDRSTCVLFGDGAGAVLLEASDEPGILSTHVSSDGKYKDLLYLDNAKMSDDIYLRMEGRQIFKLAVNWLEEVAKKALDLNKLNIEDLDWLVPHQANLRIIKYTAQKLGLPEDKIVVTVDKHANTSGASIPLALDLAIRDGRIKRGHNLLLEAFGGGLTWGSALVRY